MSGSARWCAWSVAALLACFLVSTLRPSCFVGLSSAFGKEPVCLFQAFVDGDLIVVRAPVQSAIPIKCRLISI